MNLCNVIIVISLYLCAVESIQGQIASSSGKSDEDDTIFARIGQRHVIRCFNNNGQQGEAINGLVDQAVNPTIKPSTSPPTLVASGSTTTTTTSSLHTSASTNTTVVVPSTPGRYKRENNVTPPPAGLKYKWRLPKHIENANRATFDGNLLKFENPIGSDSGRYECTMTGNGQNVTTVHNVVFWNVRNYTLAQNIFQPVLKCSEKENKISARNFQERLCNASITNRTPAENCPITVTHECKKSSDNNTLELTIYLNQHNSAVCPKSVVVCTEEIIKEGMLTTLRTVLHSSPSAQVMNDTSGMSEGDHSIKAFCPNGYEQRDNSGRCFPCLAHTYYSWVSNTCKPCPNDTVQPIFSSTHCTHYITGEEVHPEGRPPALAVTAKNQTPKIVAAVVSLMLVAGGCLVLAFLYYRYYYLKKLEADAAFDEQQKEEPLLFAEDFADGTNPHNDQDFNNNNFAPVQHYSMRRGRRISRPSQNQQNTVQPNNNQNRRSSAYLKETPSSGSDMEQSRYNTRSSRKSSVTFGNRHASKERVVHGSPQRRTEHQQRPSMESMYTADLGTGGDYYPEKVPHYEPEYQADYAQHPQYEQQRYPMRQLRGGGNNM